MRVPPFYYPIDLHYSQTRVSVVSQAHSFYYPIDLHYSQTDGDTKAFEILFYYPIDLHYSQTRSTPLVSTSSFITL